LNDVLILSIISG